MDVEKVVPVRAFIFLPGFSAESADPAEAPPALVPAPMSIELPIPPTGPPNPPPVPPLPPPASSPDLAFLTNLPLSESSAMRSVMRVTYSGIGDGQALICPTPPACKDNRHVREAENNGGQYMRCECVGEMCRESDAGIQTASLCKIDA